MKIVPQVPGVQQKMMSKKEDRMADNQTKTSMMTQDSTGSEVDAFLAEIRQSGSNTATGHGRLVFAVDATASRQPTWDTACQLQAEMFREAVAVGRLDMQLVFYRGTGECKASRWISNAEQLAKTMSQVMWEAGLT